jgi:pyruvate/2-oxoglutarate dehydrogenase complex dihydrolipoamide acyltransferase (E2) component
MSTASTAASPDDDDDRRITLLRWHRPDGAVVAADDPTCEVETDKATADVSAPEAGVLRHHMRAGYAFVVGDEPFRIDPLP